MVTAKKPAAKKPAAKKPAAKKPAAKKPAAKKPAAKTSPSKGKSVDWYASSLPAWQQEVVRQFSEAVATHAPDATSSIKWAQPVYEHAGPFAFVKAASKHVTVGFWRGAELAAPEGLFEGEGERMRHFKIREGQSLPAELGRLVREAVALNAKHGDPSKR
ncbi:MAG: DUF1801 domain-containing protein [Polyangiales bacterium]